MVMVSVYATGEMLETRRLVHLVSMLTHPEGRIFDDDALFQQRYPLSIVEKESRLRSCKRSSKRTG
jgi:hypothetical protein